MLVLAWVAILFYIVLTAVDRNLLVGLFLLPLVLVLIGSTYFISESPNTMMEAERSWKMLHASLLLFGIAGVILGIVLSMMYLFQHHRLKHKHTMKNGLKLPNLELLARLNWWAVVLTVPLLTLGLATGVGLGWYSRQRRIAHLVYRSGDHRQRRRLAGDAHLFRLAAHHQTAHRQAGRLADGLGLRVFAGDLDRPAGAVRPIVSQRGTRRLSPWRIRCLAWWCKGAAGDESSSRLLQSPDGGFERPRAVGVRHGNTAHPRLRSPPVPVPQSEAVVVSTCNRVEVYTAQENSAGSPTREQIANFFAEFHQVPLNGFVNDLLRSSGPEAVRHLFEVASSLDSMVLGEPQIVNQIKDAYRVAQNNDACGPLTCALFEGAIRVSKRVRTETGLERGRVSIASVAVGDFGKSIFDRFDDKLVLIIGAGEMAEETLRYLKDEGVQNMVVVNRSFERAEQLAKEWGGVGPIL